MEKSLETEVNELLTAVRPWFDADQSYLVDMARQNMVARLSIAVILAEADEKEPARLLLRSIVESPETDVVEHEQARLRALVELAQLLMEKLAYDEAESYLWQARNRYTRDLGGEDLMREDISLLIAQCRFGQGFVQDAIDRAEEILRKLIQIKASDAQLGKVYQQLGWFYLHKADIPHALEYLRKAMKLAPRLDQSKVDAGMEAERRGDFQRAIEHYFDAILH
jgi:tetratricopeptide (TPR) repeat protein